MGFKCGIVGLPNVGKSTLFNALTNSSKAQAGNFPFCTIEPNVGVVPVLDVRLDKLFQISKSKKKIYNTITFHDIAGLVKGASKGEGLGNKFLSHIREVDATIHVVRCFENSDIAHVENSINPLRDIEIIDTELMLADLESLERQTQNLLKKAKSNDTDAKNDLVLMKKVSDFLSEGMPIRLIDLTDEEIKKIKTFNLLTSKPVLYACNVNEDDASNGNDFTKKVFYKAKTENCEAIIISGSIEAEIAMLHETEKKEFLKELNLKESGLNRLIRTGFNLLDLITFFTVGPKETRAWTIKNNSTAPEAAGIIHTDFQKGFIRAETISYSDYLNFKSEQAAKDAGRMRVEGADYIVKDGDIFHFRFNV